MTDTEKTTRQALPELTEEFRLFDNDCDMHRLLTPRGAMRLCQQAATDHCTKSGMDMDFYTETHTAWVMTKACLTWSRVPACNEVLQFRTRPQEPHHAEWKRITEIRDESGQEIGLMDSRWVLIDTEGWRVLRRKPESYEWAVFPAHVDRELDVSVPRKVQAEPVAKFEAHYSYCDQNGHVNNTRYADLICDALPVEVMRNAVVSRLTINYRKEIMYGETVQLQRTQLEDGSWYVAGASAEGSRFFEAVVEVRQLDEQRI